MCSGGGLVDRLLILANTEAFLHWTGGGWSLHQAQRELTMSTTFAMTRMKMANMAQVFLAQRVRSIQVEKATSFLGKA